MSDIPQTDWDMVHRWEWFRRTQWLDDFRSGRMKSVNGPCAAFSELAKVVNAEVVLDSSCGLGLKTICMARSGLHVVGSDTSAAAIEHARTLAREEGVDITFFQSSWQDLPANMPHTFDAIFTDALSWTPQWEVLKLSLGGYFHALKPGGFLMFMGAPEGTTSDEGQRRLQKSWESAPAESVEWLHRDGKSTCVKVNQRTKGDDYIDERVLFISDNGEQPQLESTALRIPYYWNWPHWDEVIRWAGFSNLETHSFNGKGQKGGHLRANIAWKPKGGNGHGHGGNDSLSEAEGDKNPLDRLYAD